ncbi:MAG: FHA domain-containing protein [Gemmatimonadetes bacterium]|nr:FHA domain-containing protein [Gemmatimonadota bacterium]
MSEHTEPGTVDCGKSAAQTHEVAKFLRKYGVALVTLEGSAAGENILITRLPFIVGRGKRATMDLSNETISRRHAEIRLGENHRLELVDCESVNGCFVNGERVETALLEDGDEVRFGSVRYRLLIEARGPLTYDAA